MVDLLYMHKYFLKAHIKPGDVVADCTMGNGHDTLWLSDEVGRHGRVYAFDIQKQAVESTEKLLCEKAEFNNYTLINDSHANIKQYIKEPIKAAVFNLGYLPGGDRTLTTKHQSTLAAVAAAAEMLTSDGIVLVAVYPGHEEGTIEGEMLKEMLSGYSRFDFSVSMFRIINSPTSPFFYMIESK